MRDLTVWGAVAVLAVLVATVAVFGSTDSAQAGVCTTVPNTVTISAEDDGEDGLADNEYDVSWGFTGGCGTIDHFTVVLTVCNASGVGACKSVKVESAGSTESGISLGGAKGIASKGPGDILTASVQAKHEAGKNGMHAKGFSDSCVIEGASVSNAGPLADC